MWIGEEMANWIRIKFHCKTFYCSDFSKNIPSNVCSETWICSGTHNNNTVAASFLCIFWGLELFNQSEPDFRDEHLLWHQFCTDGDSTVRFRVPAAWSFFFSNKNVWPAPSFFRIGFNGPNIPVGLHNRLHGRTILTYSTIFQQAKVFFTYMYINHLFCRTTLGKSRKYPSPKCSSHIKVLWPVISLLVIIKFNVC